MSPKNTAQFRSHKKNIAGKIVIQLMIWKKKENKNLFIEPSVLLFMSRLFLVD